MGEALGDEGAVSPAQKLCILVTVQVERADDWHLIADYLADAPRDLGFWAGDLACCHSPVQRQVDSVNRQLGTPVVKYHFHKVLEAGARVPAT